MRAQGEGGTGVGIHAGKQRDQNLGVAKLDTPARKVSAHECKREDEESGSGRGGRYLWEQIYELLRRQLLERKRT
jgi:hypothetical protein